MKKFIFISFVVFLFNNQLLSQSDGEWKTIYTFTGTSNENTDDFVIKSSKWRIIWEANKQYQEVYGGNLIVHLIDENGNEDLIINAIPKDNGKTIIRKKGTFYLQIVSALVRWKIDIQEFVKK